MVAVAPPMGSETLEPAQPPPVSPVSPVGPRWKARPHISSMVVHRRAFLPLFHLHLLHPPHHTPLTTHHHHTTRSTSTRCMRR